MATPLEAILSILGSTSAFVAVILVCGFSISLVRLNYLQRDVLEQMSAGRERYLIRGSAFFLFVAVLIVIGLGILSSALQIGLIDLATLFLFALPTLIYELLSASRHVPRRYWIFIAYISAGVILLLISIGSRISSADWSNQLGVLSNATFIGIQLIVFATGWGATIPGGHYRVELTLENGQTITGRWIAQNGDEFLLDADGALVAVRASKVVCRTFHELPSSSK